MYLSVKQLAERYGVSVHTIWRWAKAEKFPQPVKLGIGVTRWLEADVLEWESKRNGEAA